MSKITHLATKCLLPLALVATVSSCAEQPSSTGRVPDGEVATTTRVVHNSGSQRSGDRVLRLLFGGASGAELRQFGLVVDLGSNNLFKYLQGADRETWGRIIKGGGASHVEVLNGARLSVRDRGGVRAVVLRARSETACTVTLLVDGEPAGNRRLGSDWTTLRYPLSRATRPGQRALELRLTYDGRPGAPAQARWIWLSTGGDVSPSIQRVGKRDLGTPMNSLLADRPRTYSFQVQIPGDCNLVFDYGARALTRFEVNLGVGQKAPLSLFAARAGRGTWYPAWIDLSDYAGKEVRLVLRTVAPPGRANVASGAAWGDPLLSCSSGSR